MLTKRTFTIEFTYDKRGNLALDEQDLKEIIEEGLHKRQRNIIISNISSDAEKDNS